MGLQSAGVDGMSYRSIDPSSGRRIEEFAFDEPSRVEEIIDASWRGWQAVRRMTVDRRAELLVDFAHELALDADQLAETITLEMGKPLVEAKQEVQKSIDTCLVVAEKGPKWLCSEYVPTEARETRVDLESVGPILAVMPWNFPLFQVVRFALPAILAGNSVILKHAENVQRCATMIEDIASRVDFPGRVFQNVRVRRDDVGSILQDRRIRGATVTGSVKAGRAVAAHAASSGKRTVLELGGSDPFIVLEDADVPRAAEAAVKARYANGGQSCISAKRFIVTQRVVDEFIDRFCALTRELAVGDPRDSATQIGPMARDDLRLGLQAQVARTLAMGATAIVEGGPVDGPGFYFRPTVLIGIATGSPAFSEELFGPVASVFPVADEASAVSLANSTDYGLGASVWSQDDEAADRVARQVEAGLVFLNDTVRSDVRVPFGGVKDSGYGRELGALGTREFTSAKTVWVS